MSVLGEVVYDKEKGTYTIDEPTVIGAHKFEIINTFKVIAGSFYKKLSVALLAVGTTWLIYKICKNEMKR